jgi:surfeit locus 1 family protein
VLRTALKPRWLALLAVVLVAAAVMARLGEWQLDRARQKGERDRAAAAKARPPVPLTSILAPRTAFRPGDADRRVILRGTWDPPRQLLVPGRRLGDATGLWVLTPLRLADGSGVPVVRGWVRDAEDPRADPRALPGGEVALQGVLEPSEPVVDLQPGDAAAVPAGQVALVAAPLLVQHWTYPLMTGYVVQTAATPAARGEGAMLRAVPPGTGDAGLALQNLSYAFQWWLFSAFGLFFWWRVVRDDHLGRLRPVPAGTAPRSVRSDDDDVDHHGEQASEHPDEHGDQNGEPVPTSDAGERP